MAGQRTRTTFAKLQRERARMEKQRLKREKRFNKEGEEVPEPVDVDLTDLNNLRITGDPIADAVLRDAIRAGEIRLEDIRGDGGLAEAEAAAASESAAQ